MKVFLSFFFTISFIAIVGSFSLVVYTFYNYFFIKPVPARTATYNFVDPDLDDRKLWSLIQEWRKSEGLKEFQESNTLCSIADKRILELEGKHDEDFNHDGFYKYAKQTSFNWVSENITGALSEDDALNRWLKSASHAGALRDRYPYSCVRCENEYCVQLFAR